MYMYICTYSMIPHVHTVHVHYTCSAVVNMLERPGASPGASLVRRSRNVVLSCVMRLSTNTLHLHMNGCRESVSGEHITLCSIITM